MHTAIKVMLIGLLCLLIQNNAYSQCFEKELEPAQRKQLYSINQLNEDGSRSIVVKINNNLQYKKFALRLFANSSVIVEEYSSNPCQSGTKIGEHILNDSLSVDGADNNIKYFKLNTKNGDKVQVWITPIINQNVAGCDERINKYNSLKNPTVIEELSIGQNCFEFCNEYCLGLKRQYDPKRLTISQGIKWIQLPVGSSPFIANIIVNSSQLSNPNIIVFEKDDDQLFYRELIEGADQFFFQSYHVDYVIFGIYDRDGKEGNFDLCVQNYENTGTCVNFFDEEGQNLKAIYTSKGSPKEGPYQHGELVTFQYNLVDWVPIKNNWLHGISIELANGWKSLMVDSLNRPLNVNLNEQLEVDTFLVNSKLEYYLLDTIRLEGSSVKNLVTPAWYLGKKRTGPTGPSANYKWGRPFDRVQGDIQNPLFQFEFSVLADSIIDCSVPLDGSIAIELSTDYETGKWYRSGCSGNEPYIKPAEILCCETIIPEGLQDSTYCDGEIFRLSDFVQDSTTFQIVNEPYNPYNRNSPFAHDQELLLINENKFVDTLIIEAELELENCPYTIELPLRVKGYEPSRKVHLTDQCLNSRLNISEILMEEYDDSVKLDQSDLENLNVQVDKEGVHWLQINSSFKKEVSLVSENICLEDLVLHVEAKQCEDVDLVDGYLDFSISPNPSLGPVDIQIDNQSKYSQWALVVFDQNSRKVYSKAMYLDPMSSNFRSIDLSGLKSSTYTVSISNSKIAKAKNLIISF